MSKCIFKRVKLAHNYAEYLFKDGYKSFQSLDHDWTSTIEGYQFITCLIIIKNSKNEVVQMITDSTRFLIVGKCIYKNKDKIVSICNESLSIPYLDIPENMMFLGENGEPIKVEFEMNKINYKSGLMGVITEIKGEFFVEKDIFKAIYDPNRIEYLDELEIRIDLRDLFNKISKGDKIYVYLPVKFGDSKFGALFLTLIE